MKKYFFTLYSEYRIAEGNTPQEAFASLGYTNFKVNSKHKDRIFIFPSLHDSLLVYTGTIFIDGNAGHEQTYHYTEFKDQETLDLQVAYWNKYKR